MNDPDAPPLEKQHRWPFKSKFVSKCACCDLTIHIGDLCFLMSDGTVRLKAHAASFLVAPDPAQDHPGGTGDQQASGGACSPLGHSPGEVTDL